MLRQACLRARSQIVMESYLPSFISRAIIWAFTMATQFNQPVPTLSDLPASLAREYFSYDVVLGRMLAELGV